jgi:hypothetical protein
MKIRCGYVSNSSSSSFILAINKNKYIKCNKCGIDFVSIFEFISKTFKNLENLSSYWPVPSNIGKSSDTILYAIEELNNDIKFAENELTVIREIKDDKNASIMFSKLQNAISILGVRNARFMSEYESIEVAVRNEERFIQNKINRMNEDMNKLQVIYDKIEELQGTWNIYAFTVDFQDDMHKFVVDAIDKNLVKLIKRIDG